MSTNSSNSGGIFGAFKNAISGVSNAATKAVSGKNSTNTNSSNVVNSTTKTVSGKNSTNSNSKNTNSNKTNNSKTVMPVTSGMNAPIINSANDQTAPKIISGGAVSVNYSIPNNQRQPSEDIMEYATTADAEMPSEMKNVVHGGKRRTHRRKSSNKHKSVHKRKNVNMRRSYGGKSRRSMKNKTHRKKHNKRSY